MKEELIFLGMDIPHRLRELHDKSKASIIKDMTTEQSAAYDLAECNLLYLLKLILNNNTSSENQTPEGFGPDYVVHIPGMIRSEELTYEELLTK